MNDNNLKIDSPKLYSPASAPVLSDSYIPSNLVMPIDQATQIHQPLTDGFARRLTYLRLSITDFCNFRCEYCLPNGYQGKRPDDELSVSEIATLVRGFAQVGTKK